MQEQERKRSGWLTAFLILVLTFNFLVSITNLGASAINFPSKDVELLRVVLSLFIIANLVFSIAILKWKKWGVYGFSASTFIAFIIHLNVGVKIIWALFCLIGLVIVILLLRPVWSHLK